MRSRRVIAGAALTLYTIGVAYATINLALRVPAQYWILPANTLALFVFAVAHASDRLGVRAMLVFLALTFAISFVFETVGVLTGLIYGPYYYTNRLGIKLGVVPVLIPLAWFMMMYASHTLVDIIAGNVSGHKVRERFGWPRALVWSAWLALLGAMAMTAWDLGMDPQMVAAGHWAWTHGDAPGAIRQRVFVSADRRVCHPGFGNDHRRNRD